MRNFTSFCVLVVVLLTGGVVSPVVAQGKAPAYAREICQKECCTRESSVQLLVPPNDGTYVIEVVNFNGMEIYFHQATGTKAWKTILFFDKEQVRFQDNYCVIRSGRGEACQLVHVKDRKQKSFSSFVDVLKYTSSESSGFEIKENQGSWQIKLRWIEVETYIAAGDRLPPRPIESAREESADRLSVGGGCDCERWRKDNPVVRPDWSTIRESVVTVPSEDFQMSSK